ncbi:MAG: hypothetical protein CO106_10920, partial [Deltaproteobacteria bacterium CG_4_9_14_3_um_filter_44_9]
VDAYVRYFVDVLKTISDCIIFVTTSSINQNDITCLKKTCDSVIIRENV